VYFAFSAKDGTSYSPLKQSNMFLKSIKEHSLLGQVSSYKGQLKQFSDSINEFEEPFTPLPAYLTINSIASSLLTTTSPLDTSITFASASSTMAVSPAAHRTSSFPNIQGVVPQIHTTARTAPNQRGGRRASAPRTRRTSNSGTVCRACQQRNHEEVDCRQLGRWLIFNERHKSLSRDLQRRVMDNYRRFYDNSPPAPSVARLFARQLEDFCSDRNTSPEEVSQYYDWEAFANYTEREDEGFASAQEEEGEASD
jgi:hypothetical protein